MENRRFVPAAVIALMATGPGCASSRPAISIAQQRQAAMAAIKSLEAGELSKAARASDRVIAAQRDNPYGHLVRAIARYRATMHQLSTDVRTVVFGGLAARGFNHRYMRSALERAEKELAAVAGDLAAARHRELFVELCLACWEVDWNRNGRIDRRDRLLFQIERDAEGKLLPDDDPRRRPVFRFDHGDVAWAQAFVSFQRAALDILLAYKWNEIEKIFFGAVSRLFGGRLPRSVRIRMARPELITRARDHILAGLDFAEQCRRAYLEEKDDDREWIPNPRQKNHPMPLPVDDELYETWAAIIGDLRRLVSGDDGLSVSAVAQLGDRRWANPPGGYIDIGTMLAEPKDIVFDLSDLILLARHRAGLHDVEGTLRRMFGAAYVPKKNPSPIIERLRRMKREIRRGEASLERKLRYLLWLN